MKDKKKAKTSEDIRIYPDISAESFTRCPENAREIVNSYGTYNIQPTADTDNDFPAIAQGENPEMKNRSLEFFRNADDDNPAVGGSDSDCIK